MGKNQNRKKDFSDNATMKIGIKFIIVYHSISILLLILVNAIFKLLTKEIFAYTLWFYIFNFILGLIVFPLFSLFANKLKFKLTGFVIGSIIICLCLLNSIPFFEERRILTVEVIRGVYQHQLLEFANIGIHIIAAISFVISYIFLFRIQKLWHAPTNTLQ